MTKIKNRDLIILGEKIAPGESKTINMEIARLHTMTKLKIPIIIERSSIEGPVILFSAGLHGDEINGTEIIRQIIVQKINKPKSGTIICIPIINIFGFVNQKREFPDGRDLNRVFPGSKNGSLASRFAYYMMKEIIPNIDYGIDFHSGGASRFNIPQIRIAPNNEALKKMAAVFQAPFTLYSKSIPKSFRNACDKAGIKMLLFEGGKSLDIDTTVTHEGIEGSKRILKHFNMLSEKLKTVTPERETIYIDQSSWLRAKHSGLFHHLTEAGSFVKKEQILAIITDPFGKFELQVKAPYSGYIINANQSSIVFQGDAIYHISALIKNNHD